MARLPVDKARLSQFSGRSIARYVDFVHRSSRLVNEPADVEGFLASNQPAIIALWHGQFLLAPKVKPPEMPLAIILARHGDAELFAHTLARFNTTLIRGAGAGPRRKDRGGAYALRAAMRSLEAGVSVGMSADMPPGPARISGNGIVMLARLSGRPIIPLAVATSRYHSFNTWSRMTLNLPFGTLASVFGPPIHVDRDLDEDQLEAARLAVEQGLNAATARAYQMAGADPARATPVWMREAAEKAAAERSGDDCAPPVIGPKSGRSAASGLGLGTYRLATRLIQPAASLVIGVRARRGKEDQTRRQERMGVAGKPRPAGRLVWIHAASVGELNAVLPLSQALRAARPDLRFLFTTGTVTSAGLAADRIDARDVHQYVPLDAPQFVRRFLDHWRPDVAIFTESEIWPNLVLDTARRAIPMALVNGRMSARSYSRWQRMSALARPLFGAFDVVLAQNDLLAGRFSEIGARRALSVGNLKIDSPPPPAEPGALARLREALGDRPVFVAASTHEGEERMIANAHRQIARSRPALCTLLAPRHPERGTEITEQLRSLGLKVSQRSLGGLPTDGTEIYVADTIGELGTLYAAAPVAFIGGSLVKRGGQNPIEAIRHGAAIISGPHWHNFSDAYEMLVEHNGVQVVQDADQLAEAVSRLIDDEVELKRMKTSAQVALISLAGALDRTVAELLKFLPDDKELRRAG